ncbi:MAG: acylphosphatase [Patescibacteria group bacterium]|jgi:acylphosphatase
MARHYDIKVRGRVQGIYFRLAAKELAQRLLLAGHVKNESDGSVSVAVEGEAAALETFAAWCQRGPEQATVKEAVVTEGEVVGLTQFRIL